MNKVIAVENISKLYNIRVVSSKTISQDLNRKWAKLRGREDPYLKIGKVNNTQEGQDSDFVWALKNVSFDVDEGEVIGIIGKNGAGKSTLLKILSRVSSPTLGTIKIKGKVASLLEVGTGFHPDLTGRENIFLNGTILGMSKSEILKKFEEIVNFSGVEKYIDTPVKRYSSGMTVRLAFAVAAHLDSEVLIIDEVLAVGDVEFQKKCLTKMKEVSREQGRTVLIVSHQMGVISQLCKRSILLKQGEIEKIGMTEQIIEAYIKSNSEQDRRANSQNDEFIKRKIYIVNAQAINSSNEISDSFAHNSKIVFKISVKINEIVRGAVISVSVKDKYEKIIFITNYDIADHVRANESYHVSVEIPDNFLMPGNYTAGVTVHIPNIMFIDRYDNACSFNVIDVGSEFSIYNGADNGCVFVNSSWNIERVESAK